MNMTRSLHGLDQTPWIRTENFPALQHLHRKIIKKWVFWEIPNGNGLELPMVWVNPNGNFPNHWGCFEIPMVWVITNCIAGTFCEPPIEFGPLTSCPWLTRERRKA